MHVSPGKWHRNTKYNRVEERLLQIIEKPEPKCDKNKMFCLSLVATLKKITKPQRKELTKLQLQQTLYNCLYGPVPSHQHPPMFPSLITTTACLKTILMLLFKYKF